MRALCLGLLLLSFPALAVAKGGALFIKNKDVVLWKAPKAGAAKVATLRLGTKVVWNGASKKDKQFHSITTADGKTGFVLMSNLSPNEPQQEFDAASGKPISAEAFANSGYIKCDMGGGLRHLAAAPSKSLADAQAELDAVTALNEKAGTPEALAKKEHELCEAK